MTEQRPPGLRLRFDELIVDNFAGGGGASTGIRFATGRDPDLAINHDPEALAMYRANHPGTQVLCEDVFDVDPRKATGGRPVGLGWFSPDCTFFSKARGGKPHRDKHRARRRRGLAGVVLKWAAQVRPRVIFVENVEEFKQWGPLGADGQPDPARRGESFRRWCSRLRNLGYTVEMRELRACDFGAPTSRKRLFIIARCDGEPIVWPAPTHGPGRARPFRTAAECIDWTIPCPSIFTRKKPLAEATLRRIARGIQRYVLEAKQPFIVPLTHQGGDRVYAIDEPLRTVTGANRGEQAMVAPVLARIGQTGGNGAYVNDVRDPVTTVTTKAEHLLVMPSLAPFVSAYHGDKRPGDVRGASLNETLPTQDTSNRYALVAAFLAKHYGGGENGQQPPGLQMTLPLGTITAVDHHALVASSLVKLKGTCRAGQPVTEPLGTVQAQGLHYAEVRAFLMAYYGVDQDAQLGLPMPTATTRDRFAVVTVAGIDYAIVDIGMRMLTPRELFNAQGFPADYVIDAQHEGKPLTKTAQVAKGGNSVPPPFSEALVTAQYQETADAR